MTDGERKMARPDFMRGRGGGEGGGRGRGEGGGRGGMGGVREEGGGRGRGGRWRSRRHGRHERSGDGAATRQAVDAQSAESLRHYAEYAARSVDRRQSRRIRAPAGAGNRA